MTILPKIPRIRLTYHHTVIMCSMSKSPIETILDSVVWKPMVGHVDPNSELPHATHEGTIDLGLGPMKVYQLNTGVRVLAAEDVRRIFGGEIEP